MTLPSNLYYLRKRIVHGAKRLLGLKYVPDRYAPMYRDIVETRPGTILEVGTNDGLNAVRMMRLAMQSRPDASYYGFDLFEDLGDQDFRSEFALRAPSKAQVEQHLRSNGVASAILVAGDTRVSLNGADLPQMDLIFIDGGHSDETVTSDWKHCRKLMHDRTIVYFDDYPNWGIGPVVDAIDRQEYDVAIMAEYDEFTVNPEFANDGLTTRKFQLARVARR